MANQKDVVDTKTSKNTHSAHLCHDTIDDMMEYEFEMAITWEALYNDVLDYDGVMLKLQKEQIGFLAKKWALEERRRADLGMGNVEELQTAFRRHAWNIFVPQYEFGETFDLHITDLNEQKWKLLPANFNLRDVIASSIKAALANYAKHDGTDVEDVRYKTMGMYEQLARELVIKRIKQVKYKCTTADYDGLLRRHHVYVVSTFGPAGLKFDKQKYVVEFKDFFWKGPKA